MIILECIKLPKFLTLKYKTLALLNNVIKSRNYEHDYSYKTFQDKNAHYENYPVKKLKI